LALVENDHRELDIGIHVHVIWGCVVLVVLVVPPGMTDRKHDVAEKGSGDAVRSATAISLPVTNIVGKQSYLSRGEAHKDCIEQQDPPVWGNNCDEGADANQRHRDDGLDPVIAGFCFEQARLSDLSLQDCVVIGFGWARTAHLSCECRQYGTPRFAANGPSKQRRDPAVLASPYHAGG
jgi:hypothetical protein